MPPRSAVDYTAFLPRRRHEGGGGGGACPRGRAGGRAGAVRAEGGAPRHLRGDRAAADDHQLERRGGRAGGRRAGGGHALQAFRRPRADGADQGRHRQAGALGRGHALPLGPLPGQRGLPLVVAGRRRDHRLAAHARGDREPRRAAREVRGRHAAARAGAAARRDRQGGGARGPRAPRDRAAGEGSVPGRAEGDAGDPADRHVRAQPDPLPALADGADPLARPRPYRRRRGRLHPPGQGPDDRRPDPRLDALDGRCPSLRLGANAGGRRAARLRRRALRPRRRAAREGRLRALARLPDRPDGGDGRACTGRAPPWPTRARAWRPRCVPDTPPPSAPSATTAACRGNIDRAYRVVSAKME